MSHIILTSFLGSKDILGFFFFLKCYVDKIEIIISWFERAWNHFFVSDWLVIRYRFYFILKSSIFKEICVATETSTATATVTATATSNASAANTNMDLLKIFWPTIAGSIMAHSKTFKRYRSDKNTLQN